MREAGLERVITALVSLPRMAAKPLIVAIPVVVKKQCISEAYRIYITDSLKCISENTMRFNGGSAPGNRFCEIIEQKHQDNRTAEEIIGDVVMRAGLNVAEKEV